MRSKWYEQKDAAVKLRKKGLSIRTIEDVLGIPKSTLSGWFKNVNLDESQKKTLTNNQLEALVKAREKAVLWHNNQRRLRLRSAEELAELVIKNIEITPAILDLAFAMLYLGEGKKSGSTAIANTNPLVLRFVLSVLENNYQRTRKDIVCELHLRADQDPNIVKQYWSDQLLVPLTNFTSIYIDKRTAGKPSFDNYHGVCVINCGSIAVLRKLKYVYNSFCEEVDKYVGS